MRLLIPTILLAMASLPATAQQAPPRPDSTREDSPLRRADDAEVIATDGLAPAAVVDRLVERVVGGART